MLIKFYNKLTLDCFQHWRRDKKVVQKYGLDLTLRIDFSHSRCVYDYLGTPTNFNHSEINIHDGMEKLLPTLLQLCFHVLHNCFLSLTLFCYTIYKETLVGSLLGYFYRCKRWKTCNNTAADTETLSRSEHKSSWIKIFKLALQCFWCFCVTNEGPPRTTRSLVCETLLI